MFKTDFALGSFGGGGQEPPKRNTPDEDFIAYAQAKGAARDQVDTLVNIKGPAGKPDSVTYACLMRAHDLALLLGHSEVNCIHLVIGLATDPEGQRQLGGLLPGLNADAVLQNCTSHLSIVPKPIVITGTEKLPAGDGLKAWFAAALGLLQRRSAEAKYVEVKHLLRSAEVSDNAEIKTAWVLLNGTAVDTPKQLIEAGKLQLETAFARAMASITAAINNVEARVAAHEQSAVARMERLEDHHSTLHGAVDKVGKQVDNRADRLSVEIDAVSKKVDDRANRLRDDIDTVGKKVDDRADKLSDQIAGVGQDVDIVRLSIGTHRDETAAGFNVIDGGGSPEKGLQTVLGRIDETTVKTNQKVPEINEGRVGTWWATASLIAAVAVGGGVGVLFQP